jgi:Zn finger protein HypA/HybF involved in hydrogenase expression
MASKVVSLLKNRTIRNIIILLVLLVILAIVLIVQFQLGSVKRTPDHWIICLNCGNKQISKTKTIKLEKCEKCAGKMALLCKCEDCDYEFSVVHRPALKGQHKTREELRKQRIEEERCPNCGSLNTTLVSERLKKILEKHQKDKVMSEAKD